MQRLRALEAGSEAQMNRMLDGGAGQQRIEDLEKGITTAFKGGIHLLTKGAQALKGVYVHAVSMPKRAFLVYPSSLIPCCWVHGKLSLYCLTPDPSVLHQSSWRTKYETCTRVLSPEQRWAALSSPVSAHGHADALPPLPGTEAADRTPMRARIQTRACRYACSHVHTAS